MKHLSHLRNIILYFVQWVYQPFKRFIPEETFRYAIVGGSNTAMDILLYFISYNFILKKKLVDLKLIAVSPHIASFMLVFPITFISGFILSKYITFTQSKLEGHKQLFRYGVTVAVCILLNYIFLKLFVDVLRFYPTPSKILTTGIVVVYSYFSQKYFTFKQTEYTHEG